jgi:serine/threonine protein kinase
MDEDNVFAEKYVLLRKLGEGGMAEIFLARQLGLGGFKKELVIKRIHQKLASNEAYVEMFLDEARIAANLNHPNIVHIYDIGKAFGTYYIAMEFIHGKDLMEICRRGIADKKFLPLRYSVRIISEVAAGLAFAQDHRDEDGNRVGIVHRDISPTNILVSYTGVSKLVDFGIARAASQVAQEVGTVVGKLNYMAPEQVRGDLVGAQSDLFALGVVLYEITVGRRLFKGGHKEVRDKILNQPIPPPTLIRPDYPPELEQIVMRLLEKKPENRYPDGAELQQDLDGFLADMGHKVGSHHLSRYLTGLFGVTGVGIEVEPDEPDEEEDDDLDFDSPRSGSYDTDFAEADRGELIFASRMEDEVPGPEAYLDDDPDEEPELEDEPGEDLLEAAVQDLLRESSGDLEGDSVEDASGGDASAGGASVEGASPTSYWAEDEPIARRSWPLMVAVLFAAVVCATLLLMYFKVL